MKCFPAYSAFVLMITFPGTCSVLLTGTWCSSTFLYHSDYSSSLDFNFFIFFSPQHSPFIHSIIPWLFPGHCRVIHSPFSDYSWVIFWSSLAIHSPFSDHSRVIMWSSLVIHSPFPDHSLVILWPFTHHSQAILWPFTHHSLAIL